MMASSNEGPSAASAMLPVPTSLDNFLNAARVVRAASPSEATSASNSSGSGGAPPGPGSGVFGPGELAEFVARSMEVLNRTPPATLANGLETLDVCRHSLGYSAILSALLRQSCCSGGAGTFPPGTDWDFWHGRAVVFIEEADPAQVRLAPAATADVCHVVTDELIRRGNPMAGITPIVLAISKLDPNSSPDKSSDEGGNTFTTLTSVHSDLCKLCLASKCFTPVLPILTGHDFTDISREASTGDSRHVLLYFYYGGMILAAIKNYPRALYFFEVCVTTPSVAVSHVMLEAYKKYLLVSLIEGGHRPKEAQAALPKYTSPVVTKYFKQLSGPYNELVSAYHSNRAEELQSVVAKHTATFSADGNAGLVAQVAASQTKTNIKRLTKTFLTLSTAELASRVGLQSAAEAERLVVDMIEEGSVNARISQKDGMVRFDAARPSAQYNSVGFLRKLEGSVQRCIGLDRQLSQLDEEITLNPAFVKRWHASSGSGATSGSGAGGGGPSSSVSSASGGMMMGSGVSASSALDADEAIAIAAAAASASNVQRRGMSMMNGGGAPSTGNGMPPAGMF